MLLPRPSSKRAPNNSGLWSQIRSIVTSLPFLAVLALFFLYIFLRDKSKLNGPTMIVVLGGGLTPEGKPPLHTKLRLERAVYRYHQLGDKAIIVTLSGGTPHKPNPLNENGFPIFESTAAATQLLALGVSPSSIMEESFSLDTVGNVS